MRLDQIPPFDAQRRLYRIVIETPRGSHHKYAFVPELSGFLIKKSLPEGMVFPFDFGFVPRTKAGDGDPLDALVLADAALFSGCIVPCRIVGLIEAEQTQNGKKVRNDRLIAVADCSEQFGRIRKPADLPPHILRQTELFFVHYNEMSGRRFSPLRVLGPQPALRHLQRSLHATPAEERASPRNG